MFKSLGGAVPESSPAQEVVRLIVSGIVIRSIKEAIGGSRPSSA